MFYLSTLTSLSFRYKSQVNTHAIKRTVNPALIIPSQAKRNSIELGQSNPTHCGPDFPRLLEIMEEISRATAMEPDRKSSNAGFH
jgi:hypothetical protein